MLFILQCYDDITYINSIGTIYTFIYIYKSLRHCSFSSLICIAFNSISLALELIFLNSGII